MVALKKETTIKKKKTRKPSAYFVSLIARVRA